ncbi:MAG: GTP-binding protein, partial [Candidatus Lokiarchaeota archaeon]|nr:GTP-binding protein [Candidatus Lokiarchaeota archaeon]
MDSFKATRPSEPLLLIGNKIDLENKIKISSEEGKEYAKKHNMEFIQTSAKEGSNVEEAFK